MINNEEILKIGRDSEDYRICVNDDGYLLDEEDLSQLLKDLNITFMYNDNDYSYYEDKTNNIQFKVPYFLEYILKGEEPFDDENGNSNVDDIYLNFDEAEELPIKKYQVALNAYALAELEAYSKEDARKRASLLSDKEIINIMMNEIRNNGVEIGSIDELEE